MTQEDRFFEEVRKDRGDLARVLKKHKGIRKTVEKLYPDSAHFIYELLQNAEDKDATQATFTLQEDKLIFEHDGGTFSEADVWGITDIGDGTKEDDREKIGCFGIGFKAVFTYTNSPQIYSPTFCFQLDDLVLPRGLPPEHELNKMTRFVLPFNSTKKPANDAYKEIGKSLNGLSILTLLFLSNIKEIQWGDVKLERHQHPNNLIEIRKAENEKTDSTYFLRFSERVTGLEKQNVSIAYPLEYLEGQTTYDSHTPLYKQMKVVNAEPGIVSVSFPVVKEISELRFHIHGPYITEPSRATITDDELNKPLFEQLASLAASSLNNIRDLKLLTPEFLSVLPHKKDPLPEKYRIIRETILKAMNEQPLTPTYNKGYAPAKTLIQCKASLKRLLTKTDIIFLSDYFDLGNNRQEWAIGFSQPNSDLHHLLSSLDIPYWDVDAFIELLEQNASDYSSCIEPDEEFLDWLKAKSDLWMQSMYAFLYSELEDEDRFDQLDSLLIVRVCDGSLGTGRELYFPSVVDQNDTMFPRVKETVYTSGKKEKDQERARNFLEEIGVRAVGESDLIKVILDERYAYGSEPDHIDSDSYIGDLTRFIRFVEENPYQSHIFREYYIFHSEDFLLRETDVYIDSPFRETGLSAYYNAVESTEYDYRYPLSERYADLGIDLGRIANFAIAVGAQTELHLRHTTCRNNPSRHLLWTVAGARRTSSSIDYDFTISGLNTILDKPSIELSQLIWNTLCSFEKKYRYSGKNHLKACYQMNKTNGPKYVDSQLVHILKDTSWVPQTNDTFVKPSEASIELLPDGFPYDSGQKWLEAVGFGINGRMRLAKKQREQDFAKRLGVSLEDIQFIKNNPERFQQLKEETKREAANKNTISNSKSRNPERRKQRKIERLKVAPSKETVERVRSVRVYSRSEYDHHALLAYYFDEEVDQPFCQICCHDFPFVNQRGEIYVEYVDVLGKRWADSVGVIIPVDTDLKTVLCPVCSEIYKQYIHKDLEAQKQLYNYLLEDHEDNFIICDRDKRRDGKDNRIRFHNTHLDGIRVCLESLPNLTDSSNT